VNAITNKAKSYGEDLVKQNRSPDKKNEGKPVQRKGRPALTQAKVERDAVLSEKLKFKSITDWNRKLEHMHTILTAENSNCKQPVASSLSGCSWQRDRRIRTGLLKDA
jgi:hypothetical protein